MGCNCKNDKKNITYSSGIDGKSEYTMTKLGEKIFNYTLKFLGFLIMLILLPIINIGIIWIIFKTLVLNEDVDFKPLLVKFGGMFSKDDEDEEEYEEDDLVILNVEDITNTSK